MLGKHVAIIGSTSYAWIVSYFGVVNSGGVIVPIDDKLPVNDVCELIERSDSEILIYDNNRVDVANVIKEKCPKVKYIISMSEKLHTDFTLSLNELMAANRGNFEGDIDKAKQIIQNDQEINNYQKKIEQICYCNYNNAILMKTFVL